MKKNIIKTYVLVGTGARGLMCFAEPLTKDFKESCKLLGLYDTNIKRAEYAKSLLAYPVKVYDNFDKMLEEARPDYVIIASIDCTHHNYIIKAMGKGCDVICEKPLTIDEEKCLEIFKAKKKFDRDIKVTFNCRYMPYLAKIKEIIFSGEIGDVLSINYQHMVRYEHGANYFRRWHRLMENSGGMLVHKSTHHFDVVNWLINDTPLEVSAEAGRLYYGEKGLYQGERCGDCAHTNECDFYYDIEKDELSYNLYHKVKDVDGYVRDKCAFNNDTDIYDSMSVGVKYKSGVMLTYNLTLFNPYEGYKIDIIGTKGRLEAVDQSTGIDADQLYKIKVITLEGKKEYAFSKVIGDHGGADDIMRADIFGENNAIDKLNQRATLFDGAASMIIGACANRSILEKKVINTSEFLDKVKNLIN